MNTLITQSNKTEHSISLNDHKTKSMSRERVGRILIGCTTMTIFLLTIFVSPWCLWLLVPGSFNLVLTGITDKCAIRNLVDSFGFPSEKECGAQEAIKKFHPHFERNSNDKK